jgi:hypothetical protein
MRFGRSRTLPVDIEDKGRTQKAEVLQRFLRVGPLHYFSICHSSL